MKYILYISFLAMLFSCASKRELIAPVGTIRLNDTLFIDKYPVTNYGYLEFLNSVSAYWSYRTSDSLRNIEPYGYTDAYFVFEGPYMIARSGSPKRKKQYGIYSEPFYGYPDSALFQVMMLKDTILYSNVSTNTYLTHVAYRDYPVVNISPQQAAIYCKWRTDLVNMYNSFNVKDSSEYSKKYEETIRYRLPNKEEWEEAMKKADINFLEHADDTYRGTDPLVDVYYYWQKKYDFQFYTFPGHISEIIEGKQIINSNWMDSTTSLDFVRSYESVSPGIGFRCVCEVKRK